MTCRTIIFMTHVNVKIVIFFKYHGIHCGPCVLDDDGSTKKAAVTAPVIITRFVSTNAGAY